MSHNLMIFNANFFSFYDNVSMIGVTVEDSIHSVNGYFGQHEDACRFVYCYAYNSVYSTNAAKSLDEDVVLVTDYMDFTHTTPLAVLVKNNVSYFYRFYIGFDVLFEFFVVSSVNSYTSSHEVLDDVD